MTGRSRPWGALGEVGAPLNPTGFAFPATQVPTILPIGGSTLLFTTTTPTFSWTAVPGASSYNVYLSDTKLVRSGLFLCFVHGHFVHPDAAAEARSRLFPGRHRQLPFGRDDHPGP